MYYYDDDGLRAGRVELCTNGTYGTVCNEEWDNREASVVCEQLGFSTCGKYCYWGNASNMLLCLWCNLCTDTLPSKEGIIYPTYIIAMQTPACLSVYLSFCLSV